MKALKKFKGHPLHINKLFYTQGEDGRFIRGSMWDRIKDARIRNYFTDLIPDIRPEEYSDTLGNTVRVERIYRGTYEKS